jgi:phosphatidylglycerophosphate synthase
MCRAGCIAMNMNRDGRTSERLNRFRTAPNLLTLLRICLAPFLVAAILENHYALSFGCLWPRA